MAVDVSRGLVIVSGYKDMHLHMYSLTKGTLVRSVGGLGSGKGQFNWGAGGLCMTPRGTLLVADRENMRLQEVSVDDGSWVRFVGEGVLEKPNFVHCSESVIAVSESNIHRVVLLSSGDGALLAQFGDDLLRWPCGLRVLADGTGVVVADKEHSRLCFLSLTGECVQSLPVRKRPVDVVECDGGRSYVIANSDEGMLSKVNRAGGGAVPFPDGDGPAALGFLPCSDGGGELVVLASMKFQVFRG